MVTTADYLNQLKTDKSNLVTNLNNKGVSASDTETFTSLVPKVANIPAGGGGGKVESCEVSFTIPAVGWGKGNPQRANWWRCSIDLNNETQFFQTYNDLVAKTGVTNPVCVLFHSTTPTDIDKEMIGYNRFLQYPGTGLDSDKKNFFISSLGKPPVVDVSVDLRVYFIENPGAKAANTYISGKVPNESIRDLLWENPDITQPFRYPAELDIDGALFLYNGIDIVFKEEPNNPSSREFVAPIKFSNYNITEEHIYGGEEVYSVIIPSEDASKLEFSKIYLQYERGKTHIVFSPGNPSLSSNRNVPKAIYGW